MSSSGARMPDPRIADQRDALAHRTTELASGDRSRSGRALPDAPPALDPETVLAGRYRVVRFLARGGMGEVYEAEDLVLRMRVALKSIAPELVADPGTLERLKREVLLARKVTHPNVCRLHDLGFHAREDGTTVAFLTMDLLRGDTLAQHVARKGRLSTVEALPIVRQLVAALDAAHEAGVVHRDFKARNVMLVSGTGTTPPRAVVMDFGIAFAEDEDGRTRGEDANAVGTPAYMAPEQIEGGAITPATDVYALGVVLFEMVTGGLPFEAERAIDVISMRLTRPPPSPRARVRSLDRAWDAAIVRCLARDPAARYPSAREVLAAIEVARAPYARARAAAAVLLLAAVVIGALAWSRVRARDGARAAAGPRPTLAIVMTDAGGATQDSRWIATALDSLLGVELDADEALRVVSFDRVAQARRRLGVDDGAVGAPDGIAKLRAALGFDYLVLGRYVAKPDGSVAIDAELDDARSGDRVGRVSSRGTVGALLDAAAPIANEVRARLGVRGPSAEEQAAVRAGVAGNAEAVRGYAEGRAAYAESDYARALAAFERAVAADPSYPLARDGLAQAARSLGYDARALEESRKAYEGARGLSREDQLVVEGHYRALSKDWPRAVEIARALVAFYPDNVEYGLQLVYALNAAVRYKDALAEVDRLHALPGPEGADARVDLYDSMVAQNLGLAARALDAARRAIAKGERSGETTVVAQGHRDAGAVLLGTGHPLDAQPEFEAARALYEKLGNRRQVADAIESVAQIDVARGQVAAALPKLDESLAIVRDVGTRYAIAGHVLRLAEFVRMVGDLPRSRALYEEARGLFEALHDPHWSAAAAGRLGRVMADEGDLAGARAALTELRAKAHAIDAPGTEAEALFDLSAIAIAGDDAATAARAVDDADALMASSDDPSWPPMLRLRRAFVAFAQGDVATAQRLATSAREALAAEPWVPDVVVADTLLARAAMASGRAPDAEALARGAADAARTAGMKNDEATALAVLAGALVAKHQLDEAATVLARASAVDASRLESRLEVDLARAALLAARGGGAQARALCADVAKRAAAGGFTRLAKEARRGGRR